MRGRLFPIALLALEISSLTAGGCRTPTAWHVIVRSDVPCVSAPRVALWIGPTTSAPRATAATCEGRVDDIFIRPESGRDSFSLTLATRIDAVDPSACVEAHPPVGCIVQQWKLTFRPHQIQSFETTLSKSCADVSCEPGWTCIRPGRCIPRNVQVPCDEGCHPDDPVNPTPTTAITEVWAAGDITCARDGEYRIFCWGDGSKGVLGNGATHDVGESAHPIAAPLDFGNAGIVVRLALSPDHACAVLLDGSLRCWGDNSVGQLGYGDRLTRGNTPATIPAHLPKVRLPPGRVVRDVAVGTRTTCVVLDDDSLRCWGGNDPNELGYGDLDPRGGTPATTPDKLPPIDLGPGRRVKSLSVGYAHVCVIRDDDRLVCWGRNLLGELGYGDVIPRGGSPSTTPDRLPPIDLGAGRVPVRVHASANATCAVTDDGGLRCWGYGGTGLLGSGGPIALADSPTSVPGNNPPIVFGNADLVSLFLGDASICAILSTGGVRCWGEGARGALGLGDTSRRGDTPSTLPAVIPDVSMPEGRSVQSMALGAAHTCAIFDDGSLRCWGANHRGQLGYGDTVPRGDTNATIPKNLAPVMLPK